MCHGTLKDELDILLKPNLNLTQRKSQWCVNYSFNDLQEKSTYELFLLTLTFIFWEGSQGVHQRDCYSWGHHSQGRHYPLHKRHKPGRHNPRRSIVPSPSSPDVHPDHSGHLQRQRKWTPWPSMPWRITPADTALSVHQEELNGGWSRSE